MATDETIRQTYDRLLNARRAQIKRVSDTNLKNREFGFVLTPSLILQCNYVHRLVGMFRGGMPADICVEDGGITCSNMKNPTASTLAANGSDESARSAGAGGGYDYLISRVVSLLEKPVYGEDQPNMTVNVRDEFAANIRTLGLLFEERYRLCREQGDRLSDELADLRLQLAVSKSVVTETTVSARTATTPAVDRTLRDLREQITRHEAQLKAARAQVDSLRETNEHASMRNQRQVETLLQRLAQRAAAAAGHAADETLLDLLRRLIESQEKEREDVRAAARIVDLVHDRKGQRLATELETEPRRTALTSSEEFDRLVRIAADDRVVRTVAERAEQIEHHVNAQVSARSLELEQRLRAEMEAEYEVRRAEHQHRFDRSVAEEASKVVGGGAVSLVSVKSDRAQIEIKRILDEVYSSGVVIDPVPRSEYRPCPLYTRSQSLPADDPMYTIYFCIDRVMTAARNTHDVLNAQSTGLQDLNTVAAEDFALLESFPKVLADKIVNRSKEIIGVYTKSSPSNGDTAIMKHFDDAINHLNALKSSMDEYARLNRLVHRVEYNRRYFEPPTLRDLQDDEQRLLTRYRNYRKEELNESELRELEAVRDEIRNYDADIERLRGSLEADLMVDLDRVEESFVERSVMNAACSLEKSKRNGLLVDFRKQYNGLADFAVEFGTAFKRLYRETSPTILPPPVLRWHIETLDRMFDEADKTVNFGHSPRPGRDVADIVPSLLVFFVGASNEEEDDDGTNKHGTSDVAVGIATPPSPLLGSGGGGEGDSGFTNRRRQDRWKEATDRQSGNDKS